MVSNLLMVGCGQKGPLYRPAEMKKNHVSIEKSVDHKSMNVNTVKSNKA